MMVHDIYQYMRVDSIISMHHHIAETHHLTVWLKTAENAKSHTGFDCFPAGRRRGLAGQGQNSMTDVQQNFHPHLQATLHRATDKPLIR